MTRQIAAQDSLSKAAVAVVAVIQIALAVFAFVDLARRPADGIRGTKPMWIPIILVNWIGPAAYAVFGVRR